MDRASALFDRMQDVSDAAKLRGNNALAAVNLKLMAVSEPLCHINRTLAWVIKNGVQPKEGRTTLEGYLDGMEEYISDVASDLHSGEADSLTFDTVTVEYGKKT